MRPEESPLDLNHLPEDFTRDGKQASEDTSTSDIVGEGQRRKKNSGKDERGKVYECRFCSLKFCKSQALGGHMNRHRQERETETLNKARQLVYTTDNNLAAAAHPPLPPSHLGSYVASGGVYHHQHATLTPPPPPPTQVYPTRPLTVLQPSRQQYYHHQQACMYTSAPPRLVPAGEYFMARDHALTGPSPTNNNYTCIGEPVGIHGLGPEIGPEGGLTSSSWGRTSYVTTSTSVGSDQHHHHLDSPF